MKLSKLLSTCILTFGLALPLAACDGDDDGDSSDTNADNDTNSENNETDGGMDIDCNTFCTAYIDMCLQTGKSEEFETNDLCLDACGAWDQEGTNCRYQQITDDACDQAGNMGSAC